MDFSISEKTVHIRGVPDQKSNFEAQKWSWSGKNQTLHTSSSHSIRATLLNIAYLFFNSLDRLAIPEHE